MQINRINHWLSLFQAIGFSLVFLGAATTWLKDGGMAAFLLFFLFLLFMPFVFLSTATLFKSVLGTDRMQFFIGAGLAFLVIPALTLPIFFEWEGLIIAASAILVTVVTWSLKDINKKLFVMIVIGSLLLSTVLAFLVWQYKTFSTIFR